MDGEPSRGIRVAVESRQPTDAFYQGATKRMLAGVRNLSPCPESHAQAVETASRDLRKRGCSLLTLGAWARNELILRATARQGGPGIDQARTGDGRTDTAEDRYTEAINPCPVPELRPALAAYLDGEELVLDDKKLEAAFRDVLPSPVTEPFRYALIMVQSLLGTQDRGMKGFTRDGIALALDIAPTYGIWAPTRGQLEEKVLSTLDILCMVGRSGVTPKFQGHWTFRDPIGFGHALMATRYALAREEQDVLTTDEEELLLRHFLHNYSGLSLSPGTNRSLKGMDETEQCRMVKELPYRLHLMALYHDAVLQELLVNFPRKNMPEVDIGGIHAGAHSILATHGSLGHCELLTENERNAVTTLAIKSITDIYAAVDAAIDIYGTRSPRRLHDDAASILGTYAHVLRGIPRANIFDADAESPLVQVVERALE